jgi:hypothetical protein
MVQFTETGAVYAPGNGNVIHYRRVNGIYYHVDTPDGVVAALERARASGRRIRVYYGDAKTGRDWLEEHDVEGRVGNSTGPLKVPLLIFNRRCHGGGAILDHCIVKVAWATGGVLYQHSAYRSARFVIRDIEPGKLRDMGYTHAVDADDVNHANFRSRKAAERFVSKMTR